ncbi:hypothetical protein EV421DRAFT_1739900 [Armillaria borealis]|uniref:Uncharacterized protein n=1 Tax=Armillaria borealis TaxID=47425 RepID=A0AA39J6R4_9AGAR|nr:hypothetical protein EV421DRAFT_1739900 [Armillaria borealis]
MWDDVLPKVDVALFSSPWAISHLTFVYCLLDSPTLGPDSGIGATERIELLQRSFSPPPCLLAFSQLPLGRMGRGHHSQGYHNQRPFVRTSDFVQVTGKGKPNFSTGDSGGELDPLDADGNDASFMASIQKLGQVFEWTLTSFACNPAGKMAAVYSTDGSIQIHGSSREIPRLASTPYPMYDSGKLSCQEGNTKKTCLVKEIDTDGDMKI